MKQLHGGNIYRFARAHSCRAEEVIDFSAGINPLGMSPRAIRTLGENLSRLVHYPDPDGMELRKALAERHHLEVERICIGNGSTELIHLLPGALGWRKVLIPVPSFSEYEAAAERARCEIEFLRLAEEDHFQLRPAKMIKALHREIDALFLCNPHNPTGQLLSKNEWIPLVEYAHRQGTWVVLDEAFIDYAEDSSMVPETRRCPNLIVLRSFTKFYAMPGLRVGYLFASPEVTESLERVRIPWSVNHLAQIAAAESLEDQDYIQRSLQMMEIERPYFAEVLAGIRGIEVFPSSANYLLFKTANDRFPSDEVDGILRNEKILVRNCRSFRGMTPSYLRVAVKTRPENDRLVDLFSRMASRPSKTAKGVLR